MISPNAAIPLYIILYGKLSLCFTVCFCGSYKQYVKIALSCVLFLPLNLSNGN